EFLAHILDVDLFRAEHLGLAARRLELADALAEVGGEGDNLRVKLGLKPFENNRGVEATRIGQNNLLDVFPFGHVAPGEDLAQSAVFKVAALLAGMPSRARPRRETAVATSSFCERPRPCRTADRR